MPKQKGLYIALINAHGLLRGDNLELGRDADTGGQIKYVVEFAQALIKHPKVEKVDILTRLVVDSKVSSDYAKLVEELGPGLNIIRIPFGPRRYLRKEVLWPYLENFADNTLKYLRSIGREPDLIHAHYADSGYVGAILSGSLGIPLAYTGHSLGRIKKKRLLDNGMKVEAIENTYHVGRRIEAEETALDNAEFVVASTSQEVEEQYSMYDNYQPDRMVVIPPGVDLSRFSPPGRVVYDKIPIYRELSRFLRDPRKPMILAMSRPDQRKNITTLIHVYGASERLRNIANLVVVAGSRDDIKSMEKGARDVLTEILTLIDYYDLYGQAAYPKGHTSSDVSWLYKLAAKTCGVFVNPALTEPFGLTLIEAAASGVPIVATEDGGPREIVSHCRNGLLIDPLDREGIERALLEVLESKDKWTKWSRHGITGAKKHFSWSSHVRKYIKVVTKALEGHKRRKAAPGVRSRLITSDRLLICDLDNTLFGDKAGLKKLLELLDAAVDYAGFGVATGRSLELTLKALREWNVPMPNLLITSVGTELYYGPNLVEDVGWRQHINYRWRPEEIKKVMAEVSGVTPQPEEGQGKHKISYFIDTDKAPRRREIVRRLRRADLSANVIYSHQAYLDILPVRASKGMALRYFSVKWGIPLESILVAGDSGNDEEMLTGNTLGVVVGNHDQELNKLRGRPHIYFAQGHHAWGVIEALEHYEFLWELAESGGTEAG